MQCLDKDLFGNEKRKELWDYEIGLGINMGLKNKISWIHQSESKFSY